MVNAADPNEVRLTGEHSFIGLALEENGDVLSHASHWRVILSPAGPGHVLFFKSELTDDELRVYSDNIALARWLQENIERTMRPEYGNTGIPVIDADFSQTGDVRSFWTKNMDSETDAISLTWYDFGEPYAVNISGGSMPGQPHGIYSCLVAARKAQVTLNGEAARGRPFPREQFGVTGSTSTLAFSETWVLPRGE